MKRLFAFVSVFCLALGATVAPAAADNSHPDVIGTSYGSTALNVGAAWSVFTSNEFRNAEAAAALADGKYYSVCSVTNTHASQTLFLALYGATGAEPTTNRITIPAGGTVEINMWGAYTAAIAFQASGLGTTGFMTCAFHQAL